MNRWPQLILTRREDVTRSLAHRARRPSGDPYFNTVHYVQPRFTEPLDR